MQSGKRHHTRPALYGVLPQVASHATFQRAEECLGDVLGDALLPDVPAVLSFADYIAERDHALEALNRVRANSRPATKTLVPAIRMYAARGARAVTQGELEAREVLERPLWK